MKARILAAFLLGAGVAATPAFAHGGKIETSIRDKESFSTAPPIFRVTFQHESAITSVTLMTVDNQHVAVDFKPSKAMAKEFTIPLPHLAEGSYTLSWKSLAKDGHAMPGTVHFTVTGN